MADAFSERFRAALIARLPEIAMQLRECADESLELRILAPSGHGELFISTCGEEVTVGFGKWHGHFEELDWWPDGDTPKGNAFERPISLIADLLRDLVVIRIWTIGSRYVASGPWHWWYASAPCRHGCLGDHYSAISWSGRGDLPSVPTDPVELKAWYDKMN